MLEPIDITRDRAEKPENVDILRVCSAGFSYAQLAQAEAVAVIAILNGQKSYAGAFSGMTRAQRMALVGELESLKAAILAHDDMRLFEKLPDE